MGVAPSGSLMRAAVAVAVLGGALLALALALFGSRISEEWQRDAGPPPSCNSVALTVSERLADGTCRGDD